MNYSIVIATRNRPEALRLSIPRMLEQDPAPSQLIVVDSSDDHQATVNVVSDATKSTSTEVIVLQSPRGAALQRNNGLQRVKHPIVFFPDDDSIFHPNTSKSILDVYHRDDTRQIAAVAAYESLVPPPAFHQANAGYSMEKGDNRKLPYLKYRARFEQQFFPDPVRSLGKTFIAHARLPNWAAELKLVPVEWMTGFRMTFRTEVIAKHTFDINLTRYSLFEDRDASMSAWREGAVVATPQARIFHYRSPEKRDNGARLGMIQILNLAYITAKHSPVGHESRKQLKRFCRYKILLYQLSKRDKFSSDRYQGAKAALKFVDGFVRIPSSEAASLYNTAQNACECATHKA